MKKAILQSMKEEYKTVLEIEQGVITEALLKELNEFFKEMYDLEQTDFQTTLKYDKKDNIFKFNAIWDEECTFICDIENVNDINLYNLLKTIISEVYDQEINWRTKATKSYNAFLRRKATSLTLWNSRDNKDKVDKIVQDVIEKYKNVEEYNSEVATWKDLVGLLYSASDTFCKEEKLIEKQMKIQKQIDELIKVKDNNDIYFVS